jgi:DNA-binding transcriptional ArsR family regulator
LVEQPTRAIIESLVAEHGGLHKSEICRRTGRGWGTVGHHLTVLERHGRVHLEPHGTMLWVFRPEIQDEDRQLLVTLSERGRAELLDELSKREVCTIRELSDALEESQKVIRTHVSHLMAVGAVQRTSGNPHLYSAIIAKLGKLKFLRP